jgi:aryl-alcohol dehydrogenase-like predicted oxidoreductase
MTSLDFGPLVLGGNTFGWTSSREESFAVLDAFVAAGGRSIDSAEGYSHWVPGNSGGESESIIGEWAESRGMRDDLVIATKVWGRGQSGGADEGLDPTYVRGALDASLARLRTDHIDVYYAHRDDPRVPQDELMAMFDGFVKAGKVREVGVSNWKADRIRSAQKIAVDAGLTPITIAQDHYNLIERSIETANVPALLDLGIVELPYYGLAAGFLTGKYRSGAAVESARAGTGERLLQDPRNVELLGVLDDIAAAHGVSVASVALAWLRQQPVVAAPIASARIPDQVAALAESFALELSAEELARLH